MNTFDGRLLLLLSPLKISHSVSRKSFFSLFKYVGSLCVSDSLCACVRVCVCVRMSQLFYLILSLSLNQQNATKLVCTRQSYYISMRSFLFFLFSVWFVLFTSVYLFNSEFLPFHAHSTEGYLILRDDNFFLLFASFIHLLVACSSVFVLISHVCSGYATTSTNNDVALAEPKFGHNI